MIVPSGKQRQQVNQGICKNESIFESDLFKNLTTAQAQQLKEQPKDLQMSELADNMTDVEETPVDDVMRDSNSPRMNDSFNAEPEIQEPEIQFDQESDGDILGESGEFIDIADRISQKVIQSLGLHKRQHENWIGKTEISNNGKTVDSITIKLTNPPPKVGPMVEKGGEPFRGGMEQPGQQPRQSPGAIEPPAVGMN